MRCGVLRRLAAERMTAVRPMRESDFELERPLVTTQRDAEVRLQLDRAHGSIRRLPHSTPDLIDQIAEVGTREPFVERCAGHRDADVQ